ncbi:MAG: acylphosphatase [Thermoanaerobaculales bacterium]
MPVRRYVVHGRVQGVGFRAFVWREATELKLAGWVRNNPDGTVELLVEAPERAQAELEGKLGEGPRWAAVTRVDIEDEPGAALGPGFTIG